MPLYHEGEIFELHDEEENEKPCDYFLNDFKDEFGCEPPEDLSEKKVICVMQREYAVVTPDDCDYIGSTDATSCVILAIRSPITGKVALAHFDSSEGDALSGEVGSLVTMFECFSEEESEWCVPTFTVRMPTNVIIAA